MKSFKKIFINLILTIILVTLTGGMIIATNQSSYSFRIKNKFVNGRKGTYIEVTNGSFDSIRGIQLVLGSSVKEEIRDNKLSGTSAKLSKEYPIGQVCTIKELETGRTLGTAQVEDLDPVNTGNFSGIQLIRENLKYYLVFNSTLKDLEGINHGKKFTIEVREMGNRLIQDISSGGKRQNRAQIDAPLYEARYGGEIKVRIRCEETNLQTEYVILQIPPLVDIGYAKYENHGKATIHDKNGTQLTSEVVSKTVGYTTGKARVQLGYNHNGWNVLDEGAWTGNRLDFDAIQGFDVYDPSDYNGNDSMYQLGLQQFLADNAGIYNYYLATRESGGVTLSLGIITKDGNMLPVPFINPPSFEQIIGISIAEFDEMVGYFEAALDENATCVTDGVLEISASESYKDFYVTEKGIYYLSINGDGLTNRPPQVFVIHGNGASPILFAGRFIDDADGAETSESDMPLGEYIYYDNGTVTFGKDKIYANCYPFVANAPYRIENNTGANLVISFDKVAIDPSESRYELVEIFNAREDHNYYQLQSQLPMYQLVRTGYIMQKVPSLFENICALLAKFVRSLANGLNYLVQFSLQSVSGEGTSSVVDIDTIIFNRYPDTSIAFFASNRGDGEEPSKIIGFFRDGVNKWYSVFTGIAISGYLIILLYIGVKILLSVGSNKQAEYREMLTAWIKGILVLAFFPYVISFCISINNSLVKTIDNSKMEILEMENVESSIDLSDFSMPSSPEIEDYQALASQMDENPFTENDNSYMAVMARRAHQTSHLVDAVVYLIMVWQFIMIVILYYKRVFTVAFLMAIFPFVALFYVIDKIGDNKAQSFQTWNKEMMVNIFIQSIHAIVYVFVIGATYADGQYSGDWLLSIVAISFLFKGEEILKKIIGQDGQTIKSLAKTALRTIATVKAVKYATSRVADNVVGANSHLGRSVTAYKQWQKERKIAKNMDILAPSMPAFQAAPLSTFDPSLASDPHYSALANDIETLNNFENVNDPEALARALENVMANKNSTDANTLNLMKSLNLSDDQLNALSALQGSVVNELIDGYTDSDEGYSALKERIDQNMDIKLRMIFPDNPEQVAMMKRAMYFKLRDGNADEKHKARSTDMNEIKEEFKEAQNRKQNFFARSGVNPFSDNVKPSAMSTWAESKRESVLSTFYKTDSSRASYRQKRMADSIAMLKDFGTSPSTKYTSKQIMSAAKYVSEHQRDSQQDNRAVMTTLGLSGDEVMAVVSEEIGRNYTDTPISDKKNFRNYAKKGRKKISFASGTRMEQKLAEKNIDEAWEESMEYIKANDTESKGKSCYKDSLDKVSVKDILRIEREPDLKDSIISDIQRDRRIQNDIEIRLVEDFAREQLDDLPEILNAPTYDGLTKEEHEQYADSLRDKFVEELARTGLTTTGVALGATIGAGLNIGLSDDSSALEEAAKGVVGGAIIGDTIGETIMGNPKKTKKIIVVNPYTGEKEEFNLQKSGITKGVESGLLIKEGEILRHDDPRLAGFRYNLDKQLLESKQKYEKKKESERKKQAFSDALKNNRN